MLVRVGFACQSGEENTRGPLKVPGRLGSLRALCAAEVADADSLYLRDTQNLQTNTCSL